MEADRIALAVQLVGGALVLLFGRRLFWLFVAVVGFVASAEMAPIVLPGQPPWVLLAVALAVGVLGALAAVVLQYAVAAAAGFVAGGFVLLPLARLFPPFARHAVTLAGAIAGALFVLLVFDWALVVLSALAGAAAVLRPFALPPFAQALAIIALAAVGAGVQAATLRRAERAP